MQVYNISTSSIGTNTYVVVDEKSSKGFIVDPGGYSDDVAEAIRKLNVSMKYIMLTHGHGDHIMGVPQFMRAFPGIKVVAHAKEAEMLGSSSLNMSDQFGQPTEIVADILVEDGDVLELGTLKIKFLYTPGHSPGGMCIYVESENILFSGDTLFQNSIGRTDFPGCSYTDLVDSVHNKLWPLPDETIVYPGHMGATKIGFERKNNPFV